VTHRFIKKPNQAKVIVWSGHVREAQVDVPLSVSHSASDGIAGLCNRNLNSKSGICKR